MSKQLVVLGGSGFLGQFLLKEAEKFYLVKASYKNNHPDNFSEKITWFNVDLLKQNALDQFIDKGDILINLAYTSDNNSHNVLMINNIIESCIKCGVKKLIHCSTAIVVGDVKSNFIDEETLCSPKTEYEKNKYDIEQCVLGAQARGLQIAILRPTGIIGAHGQNLKKLSEALLYGNPIVNYLRTSIAGKRKMNLVPASNVAAALLHLVSINTSFNNPIYIISSDDESENNFFCVERILLKALNLRPRRIPVFQLPLFFLALILRLLRKPYNRDNRLYCSKKLYATQYVAPDTLKNAILDFGVNYK